MAVGTPDETPLKPVNEFLKRKSEWLAVEYYVIVELAYHPWESAWDLHTTEYLTSSYECLVGKESQFQARN